ncbi:hypothetical protein FISHEDRAFT_66671 [Fistulina hepatica ATCC 64428]|uniref:Mitochondrial fission process protein 1 n=1 Tax=Fistulina hepatica ATCC 64428 TaxID=1128425 RepID=A0A0D7A4Z4_9AGAR|nr:hypothetical protein FISHEDRAFT_66671 [Fistulina hepatica ATCC 64428]
MSSIKEEAKQEVRDLARKDVDSTDSGVRYLAYGARLRTALRAGTRYIAYTSDVGEAFRPVVVPWVVTAAYAVSWAYLFTDVSYETYKAKLRGPSAHETNFSETTRLGLTVVQRATFQSIASMGLPALTIHTTVSQVKRAFKNVANPRIKAWGPTMTGLAVVPILPYLFDHPVEVATDKAFDWIRDKLVERMRKPEASKNDKEL